MTDSYNGWASRETWAVVLWIDNDQGWQEMVFDAVLEAETDAGTLDAGTAGDVVRQQVESLLMHMLNSGEAGRRTLTWTH